MSFTSYPIITQGSNIDIVRQGHNLLTTNLGDMNGLQTTAHETIVDAINSLNSAFSALTVSAYPPLNNEQWLTATIQSGFGTLNLFKLSSTNELIIGQHLIPLSTLIDLGKVGTAWRAGYITTLNTTKIQAITNLELATATTLTLTFGSSQLILSEVDSTHLKLETVGEGLDIKSLQTRLYSGAFLWDNTTSGHFEPGTNQTQNIGSSTKQINTVHAKNIHAYSDVTFDADIIAPNAGLAVPVGGSCIWFTNTIPTNYLVANGQAVSRTTYAALFTALGSGAIHGVGDGINTFNLPDMRSRIPFGVNSSQTLNPDASSPGKQFGSLNHTHNTVLPKHYHTSSGLNILDHSSQVTGTPSVLPSASFAGNALGSHGHGVTDGQHSHTISAASTGAYLTQSPHVHGASLGDHSHPLDCGTRGSGNTSGNPANWSSVGGAGQIGLFSSLSNYDIFSFGAGALGVSIAGDYAQVFFNDPGHNHAISTNPSNISINGASAGTPSGTVTLTNTSHTHTIPTLTHTISGTVGITAGAGGTNGDVDQTLVSNSNNPPCFAVHFIIRAK